MLVAKGVLSCPTCKIGLVWRFLGVLAFKCLHMFTFPFSRSFRPSQPDQFAGHQHDTGRRGPGDSPPELDPAGGAGYSCTPLQSVLELDCAHQVPGAIQEEKEKDHPRGNLVSLSSWCVRSLPHFPRLSLRLKSLFQDYLCTFLCLNIHIGPQWEKERTRNTGWIYLYVLARLSIKRRLMQCVLHCFNSFDWWTLKCTLKPWKKPH